MLYNGSLNLPVIMFLLPENVISLLLIGEDLEYIVFKSALNFSELGHSVWIYSPKQIKEIPKSLNIFDKQVLKSLTFLYLKDSNELLAHLNGVQLWHKTPKLTILTGFEEYCNLLSPNFNLLTSSFVIANLYDALKVFSTAQNNGKVFLLVTIKACLENVAKMEKLKELYFPNVYNCANDTDSTLSIISDFFMKK